MLALPLLAVLGSPVAWVLMLFFAAALWAVWRAITANQSQRSLHEALRFETERVHLAHRPTKGPALEWEANPYWIDIQMTPKGGKVENYLTLKGAGREVELGAFLSPEERLALTEELEQALVKIRTF